MRIIALIDLDYFYAQCEIVKNKGLLNKPVVIVMQTIRENVGAVATCNYEARKLKIRSGMSLSLAKKLANDETFFIKANKDYYEQVSYEIFNILDKYSENVEQVSIDEAYFDLSKCVSFEKAVEVCNKLKEEIYSQTKITCSIGISINKLLAKISSNEKKPNGLFVVKKNEVDNFLLNKNINELHGLGPKSQKILNKKGIKIISDLRLVQKQELIELFGKSRGIQFYEFSRGIDNRNIDSNREKKQISRLITLEEDTFDLNKIKKSVDFLCDRVFRDSLISKKNFKTIAVILIDVKNNSITKSVTPQENILNLDDLKKTSHVLLEEILKESIIKYKRVGIRLSNFSENFGYQKKLFDFGGASG